MWCERAPIHNLSVSQMWVTWGVDRGEHWVLISGGKKVQSARGAPKRREWGGRAREVEGMQARDGWAGRWGGVGGRRWSTGKPLRMAVLPDTGSDWERKRETREDWRRERKNEREVNTPHTTPPFRPTPPVSPPPQSIWPCQNIKCMLLLLSKRCLRFLKALIRGRVDGNQGIFSCAKRGNNTQLIIAQQRGLDCVCKECTGQITTLQQERSHGGGRSRIRALSAQTGSEICLWGEHKRENELMALDFYWSICQKHFTR